MLIRKLMQLGLVAATIIGLASAAQSQGTGRYPSGPVKLIVPYAPGGLVDTIARHLGNAASQSIGQPVIIENRPGAGGRVAAALVSHAAPDGQTLLFTTLATLTISPLIPPKPNFDVGQDFTPVVAFAEQALFVAVRTSLDVKDLHDLIAVAKATPGKLTYGSPGPGTESHLVMERFARNARIELLHIPYRGGGMAVTDLMGDRIDLVALSEIALRPAIDTGKAKLLATLDPTRGFGFPDVPSIAEAGYPSDVYVPRIALFGPPKLRDDVVARWVNLMPDLKANEAFVKGMKETGSELSVVGPTELRLLLETDSHAWQPLITELDLKSE